MTRLPILRAPTPRLPKGPCARRLALLVAGMMALWPLPGYAHDAASWGGLFRTSDDGATWFQSNHGRLVSGALAVAVSPSDPGSLLLGTDGGLLGSRNGGLDWDAVAPDLLVGPVFAIASDGQHVLVATARALFRSDDGVAWAPAATPLGASPARSLVWGGRPGEAYLVGWQGLFRTDDWGGSWIPVDGGLPSPRVGALVVDAHASGLLVAVVDGALFASPDGAHSWQRRGAGLAAGGVQALALDPRQAGALWAAGQDQVFRSADRGVTWAAVGAPLPDRETDIRGIAPSGDGSAMVLSTHRGLYRSQDGGQSWTLLVDNVPGHLEAGPLVRDPSQPSALYAGFSLTPYDEQWARAADGRSLVSGLTTTELLGAAAFLVTLGLGAMGALRALSRGRRGEGFSLPAPESQCPGVSLPEAIAAQGEGDAVR